MGVFLTNETWTSNKIRLSSSITFQTVWSPHADQDIDKIKSAQRRAVRWATRDYRFTSSVTEMLRNTPGAH